MDPLSKEQIDEFITFYITDVYHSYNLYDTINDIENLRQLLQNNPVITHYPSPAKYYSRTKDDVMECLFSELAYTDIYDMLHYSPGPSSRSISTNSLQTPSPASEKDNKFITEFIVDLYEIHNITEALPTIPSLRKLLETNPLTYHYCLSGSAIWSYTPLFQYAQAIENKDYIKCHVSELPANCIYNMLTTPEASNIEYQSSLSSWA